MTDLFVVLVFKERDHQFDGILSNKLHALKSGAEAAIAQATIQDKAENWWYLYRIFTVNLERLRAMAVEEC